MLCQIFCREKYVYLNNKKVEDILLSVSIVCSIVCSATFGVGFFFGFFFLDKECPKVGKEGDRIESC